MFDFNTQKACLCMKMALINGVQAPHETGLFNSIGTILTETHPIQRRWQVQHSDKALSYWQRVRTTINNNLTL